MMQLLKILLLIFSFITSLQGTDVTNPDDVNKLNVNPPNILTENNQDKINEMNLNSMSNNPDDLDDGLEDDYDLKPSQESSNLLSDASPEYGDSLQDNNLLDASLNSSEDLDESNFDLESNALHDDNAEEENETCPKAGEEAAKEDAQGSTDQADKPKAEGAEANSPADLPNEDEAAEAAEEAEGAEAADEVDSNQEESSPQAAGDSVTTPNLNDPIDMNTPVVNTTLVNQLNNLNLNTTATKCSLEQPIKGYKLCANKVGRLFRNLKCGLIGRVVNDDFDYNKERIVISTNIGSPRDGASGNNDLDIGEEENFLSNSESYEKETSDNLLNNMDGDAQNDFESSAEKNEGYKKWDMQDDTKSINEDYQQSNYGSMTSNKAEMNDWEGSGQEKMYDGDVEDNKNVMDKGSKDFDYPYEHTDRATQSIMSGDPNYYNEAKSFPVGDQSFIFGKKRSKNFCNEPIRGNPPLKGILREEPGYGSPFGSNKRNSPRLCSATTKNAHAIPGYTPGQNHPKVYDNNLQKDFYEEAGKVFQRHVDRNIRRFLAQNPRPQEYYEYYQNDENFQNDQKAYSDQDFKPNKYPADAANPSSLGSKREMDNFNSYNQENFCFNQNSLLTDLDSSQNTNFLPNDPENQDYYSKCGYHLYNINDNEDCEFYTVRKPNEGILDSFSQNPLCILNKNQEYTQNTNRDIISDSKEDIFQIINKVYNRDRTQADYLNQDCKENPNLDRKLCKNDLNPDNNISNTLSYYHKPNNRDDYQLDCKHNRIREDSREDANQNGYNQNGYVNYKQHYVDTNGFVDSGRSSLGDSSPMGYVDGSHTILGENNLMGYVGRNDFVKENRNSFIDENSFDGNLNNFDKNVNNFDGNSNSFNANLNRFGEDSKSFDVNNLNANPNSFDNPNDFDVEQNNFSEIGMSLTRHQRNSFDNHNQHMSVNNDQNSLDETDQNGFFNTDQNNFANLDQNGFADADENGFADADENGFSNSDQNNFSNFGQNSFSNPGQNGFSNPGQRSFANNDAKKFNNLDQSFVNTNQNCLKYNIDSVGISKTNPEASNYQPLNFDKLNDSKFKTLSEANTIHEPLLDMTDNYKSNQLLSNAGICLTYNKNISQDKGNRTLNHKSRTILSSEFKNDTIPDHFYHDDFDETFSDFNDYKDFSMVKKKGGLGNSPAKIQPIHSNEDDLEFPENKIRKKLMSVQKMKKFQSVKPGFLNTFKSLFSWSRLRKKKGCMESAYVSNIHGICGKIPLTDKDWAFDSPEDEKFLGDELKLKGISFNEDDDTGPFDEVDLGLRTRRPRRINNQDDDSNNDADGNKIKNEGYIPREDNLVIKNKYTMIKDDDVEECITDGEGNILGPEEDDFPDHYKTIYKPVVSEVEGKISENFVDDIVKDIMLSKNKGKLVIKDKDGLVTINKEQCLKKYNNIQIGEMNQKVQESRILNSVKNLFKKNINIDLEGSFFHDKGLFKNKEFKQMFPSGFLSYLHPFKSRKRVDTKNLDVTPLATKNTPNTNRFDGLSDIKGEITVETPPKGYRHPHTLNSKEGLILGSSKKKRISNELGNHNFLKGLEKTQKPLRPLLPASKANRIIDSPKFPERYMSQTGNRKSNIRVPSLLKNTKEINIKKPTKKYERPRMPHHKENIMPSSPKMSLSQTFGNFQTKHGISNIHQCEELKKPIFLKGLERIKPENHINRAKLVNVQKTFQTNFHTSGNFTKPASDQKCVSSNIFNDGKIEGHNFDKNCKKSEKDVNSLNQIPTLSNFTHLDVNANDKDRKMEGSQKSGQKVGDVQTDESSIKTSVTDQSGGPNITEIDRPVIDLKTLKELIKTEKDNGNKLDIHIKARGQVVKNGTSNVDCDMESTDKNGTTIQKYFQLVDFNNKTEIYPNMRIDAQNKNQDKISHRKGNNLKRKFSIFSKDFVRKKECGKKIEFVFKGPRNLLWKYSDIDVNRKNRQEVMRDMKKLVRKFNEKPRKRGPNRFYTRDMYYGIKNKFFNSTNIQIDTGSS